MKYQTHFQQHPRRGGAVIIVVVSLMATLAFLGLFFYNWSNQERINAEYYSDTDPVEIDPDPIFDEGLQQLIVSTPQGRDFSALAGDAGGTTVSFWSMLAHVLGPINENGRPLRTNPYAGQGVRVNYTDSTVASAGMQDRSSGGPGVDGLADDENFVMDYDWDGTNDAFRVNFSAATTNGTISDLTGTAYDFAANAGYTYPDINCMFVSYEGFAEDEDGTRFRVVIPSFHRPQYFPTRRNTGNFNDLFSANATVDQVLRPHERHKIASGGGVDSWRYVTNNGSGNGTNGAVVAKSGDRNRIIEPFPFPSTTSDGTFDADGDGALLEHGVFTDADDISYDFEVDIDRDGIRDAIRMDLDHPIINLPNGRQVVPLYSFKVRDLDGLVNLNVHGNINGILSDPSTVAAGGLQMPFGAGEWISKSNSGLSMGEINPAWALNANPGDGNYIRQTPANEIRSYAQQEHDYFYDNTSSFNPDANALNWRQMANMELGWLLFGRERSDGVQIAGRWFGDSESLTRFTSIPFPGTSNSDDDLDSNGSIAASNSHPYGGFSYMEPDLGNLIIPPFVHPIDLVGAGGGHLDNVGSGQRRSLAQLNTTPGAWPDYDDRWQNQGTVKQQGVTPYPAGLQPAAKDWLTDEADEVLTNRGLIDNNEDAVFPAAELAALHLSDADWESLGASSRVRELAPFNFELNRQASRIRQRFTTISSDRTEASIAVDPNRQWEFSNWTHDTDPMQDRTNAFPPQFQVNVESDGDPFRPELRKLLMVELGGGDSGKLLAGRTHPQRRLNINRLLVNFDSNGDPVYRHLTPHPEFVDTDTDAAVDAMVHVNNPTAGNPGHPGGGHAVFNFAGISSDKHVQEFWARYDRQRLARDIFCLLYVLGGADNSTNITNTAFNGPDADGDGVPDPVQEMAQFAVNYVDALDRDSVITEFEFDYNLSDGWGNNLAKVNGVEAQQLTISEALWIKTDRLDSPPTDLTRTSYADDGRQHQFLYIELRNASPFRVDLKNETWRIVREDTGGLRSARMTFQESTTLADKFVDPGEVFVLSTHDGRLTEGMTVRSSDFYVDTDATTDNQFQQIIPIPPDLNHQIQQADTPAPHCHLDMCYPDQSHSDFFTIEVTAPLEAKMVGIVGSDTTDDPTVTFDLVLERRRNLQTADRAQQDDDPLATRGDDWIEVDRVTVNAENFDPQNDNDVIMKLNDMKSTERSQPLVQNWTPHATGGLRDHTFDQADQDNHRPNSNFSGPTFNLWQPHFDRDYQSTAELLSVPLFSPDNLIASLATSGTLSIDNVAAAKFLFAGDPNAPQDLAVDNRWYRLFEFVEVPHPTDARLSDRPISGRTRAGKINLNMVRDENVYAALIDDDRHFDPPSADPERPAGDQFEIQRNWYHEFLVARDGLDPITNLPIPGVPGAFPFTPASRLNSVNSDLGLSNTTLRVNFPWSVDNMRNLQDNAPANIEQIGLFEARSSADVGSDVIDFHTRNRILDKIQNLTTNRSHVFAVWVQVDFFEAHQPTSTTTQIGGLADDLPSFRMFCVIDMSRLEDAYVDTNTTDGTPGTFDFRKFIIHRQMLP